MAKMLKKNIEDIELCGKRVIARVDFNVPLDKKTGEITDDKRIRAALPTIRYLIEKKAKIILVSHLGRPKNGPEEKFSMKPAAVRLSELLGKEVIMAADVVGEDAKAKAAALKEGEILMLENVRFHKEETKNAPEFAAQMASMAEVFINDAFGTAHRAHASTAGIANYLPAVSGYLIQKEIDVLGEALENPKRPFVAILGGAKVSDKIGVIENLLGKVDTLIIGGGMAYTFDAAIGREVGTSICETDKIELAASLMEKAKERGVNILLPIDNVVAKEFSADSEYMTVDCCGFPSDWMGLDIGEKTIELFANAVKDAGTVVWNGPMGVFEFENFASGTRELARAVAQSDAISIIGGGDSAAAIEQLGFADEVTHISTGGGASLEFLEGKVLPGIDCLMDKDPRRTFAAGNWKMNKGVPSQAVKLIEELKVKVADETNEIAVGVPFTALEAVREACEYTNIKVAAQNCHFEDKGAYTGEISAQMLAQMGVKYVIIGHSERREYFAETDATVNKKISAALKNGLRPIVCCGESLAQRESGETFSHVGSQIKAAFADIAKEKLSFITIAYEPIWAIGTGKVATNDQAQEVCAYIRGVIAELYGKSSANDMRILYGGSVSASTAQGLFNMPDIDGGLVGGASLKPDDFAQICKA
ncbi:MAG: triose-phosphate isomerase [Eubacteriales bacterium]|nr:triose-phosphate isomerase [Eubacteriales bacterium]